MAECAGVKNPDIHNPGYAPESESPPQISFAGNAVARRPMNFDNARTVYPEIVPMPLTRIHAPEHLPAETVAQLADAVHASLVHHCKVPPADFFQLIHRMEKGSMRLDPHFPNVTRSANACVVEIAFLQGRTDDQKRALYRGIVEGAPGLAPDDILVALIENTHMDWSLGRGEAYADLQH